MVCVANVVQAFGCLNNDSWSSSITFCYIYNDLDAPLDLRVRNQSGSVTRSHSCIQSLATFNPSRTWEWWIEQSPWNTAARSSY